MLRRHPHVAAAWQDLLGGRDSDRFRELVRVRARCICHPSGEHHGWDRLYSLCLPGASPRNPASVPPILNSIRAIPERDHLDDPTAFPSSLTAPPRLSLASPQTNYKFQYDDTFVYENPLCSYLTADELVVKTTSGSLFVTTHIDHKKVYREPAANEAACPTDSNQVVATDSNSDTVTSNHNVLSTSSDGFSFANGICKYTQNTNLFPVGVEAVNMELLHEFTTLSDIYGDVNPKTFIRRKGDDTDRKVIAAGEAIKLSVGDLLEIAGVDLDKPFDEQPSGWNPPTGLQGRGTSAGAYPYPRLTGTRLSINIQYYNYNLDDTSGFGEMGTPEVYAIVEVEAKVTWTSRGQDVRYRAPSWNWNSPVNPTTGQPEGGFDDMYVYGLNIDVSATGNVAAFNFQLFVQTIVSGLVFLGVAKTVCDFVAINLLGVKSKLYKTFIQEEVDLERECARYAIQALVATEFFRKKDEDGSGNLDLNEVQEMLRGAFTAAADDTPEEDDPSNLTNTEISALALYILRTADEDRAKNRLLGEEKGLSELAGSSISLREFINMFTGDTVNIPVLKDIVNLTDLDEQVASYEEETGGKLAV